MYCIAGDNIVEMIKPTEKTNCVTTSTFLKVAFYAHESFPRQGSIGLKRG
jgi:hypothetical protein